MCGIVGIVGPPLGDRDEVVLKMGRTIAHRGPDEAGHYADARVSMAMQRLAIQDVMHGHQPASDESGDVVCMFNGEIYNVLELQALLRGRGHHLVSESDTECIPHLYEEFGVDFVDHLRGMFSIALWDKRTETFILVRDRLGKKPLYYWDGPHGLSYASELKALLSDSRLPREADPVAINHYLTLQYVPAPWSAIEGVKKLPPGHILVNKGAATSVRRYWHLEYAPEGTVLAQSDDELVEELRSRLTDCVSVRMISERPLGAFLSGGLDSSAVVAAMSQLNPGQVKTFSIGFEDQSLNELPYARAVAERYGTDHHEMIVKPDALDIVPKLAGFFDEPYADSSAIPSWYLAEMASKHVVVALNGDGGDETLGGYSRYLRYLMGSSRRISPAIARTMLAGGMRLRPLGARSAVMRKLSNGALLLGESEPDRRYARFLSYFRPEQKVDIYTHSFNARMKGHDTYALIHKLWTDNADTDQVNRLLAVDTHSYLPGDLLPKVDITTMSVSLEARSPFLDHTFVEWAASIPGARKIVGQSGKHLLKRALEGWIDHDLIYRKKQGFGVPLGDWLRGPLRTLVYDTLTDDTAKSRQYFDPRQVKALIDDHMAGLDQSPQLYALLMLELWHREVLR